MKGIVHVGGGSAKLEGNAQPSDVLSGKTFYSTDPKNKLTGTAKSYDQGIAAGKASVKYTFSDGSSFNWSDVVWNSSGVSYNSSTMIPIVVYITATHSTNSNFQATATVSYGDKEIVYAVSSIKGGSVTGKGRYFIPIMFNSYTSMVGKSFSTYQYGPSFTVTVYGYIPR